MPLQTIDLGAAVRDELEERRVEAENRFREIMDWLLGPSQELVLHDVERELLGQLMALGGALMALWLALRVPEVVPVRVRHGRGWYAFRDMASGVVRTRFGVVRYTRAVYASISGNAPAQVAPQDRHIGLADGRMTLGVHLLAAWLSAKLVFEEVGEVAAQFGSYIPSKRALLGIVDSIGPHASSVLDSMEVPRDDGEVLVIQCDEKGAPMMTSAEHALRCRPHTSGRHEDRSRAARRRRRRDEHRPRRKKGDKSKNARMATVFVIYTLRRAADGTLEGPLNKRVMAGFGRDRMYRRALEEARRRGYGSKPTYFLADGAKGLWTLQVRHFPDATPCLDWYHLCEYLWNAGTAGHAEGSAELAAWVHQRKEELLDGRVDDALAALDELGAKVGRSGPGTRGRRKRVHDAIRYISNNRERLRYAELKQVDMDIATGAVEGAVNHVVGRRLDGSMMRWSPARADHVLALRCVAVNGLWHQLTTVVSEAHARRRDLVVPRITPSEPQKPHDAVRKAA